MRRSTKVAKALALATAGLLTLSGCSGEAESTEAAGKCGTFTIPVSPWVGYEANAAVVGYLAKHELGCEVVYQEMTEVDGWHALAAGEVDAILENWGHEDLKERYIEQEQLAMIAGMTGNEGIIGWFVPPWMAEEYPDIIDWRNLNKYASLFRTAQTGRKGQFLAGDPSYVTNDEALVENLDLDFEVVYSGSEDALIEAFRDAEEHRKPLIGYFYEPQWFMSEVRLVRVSLPPYDPGCDADPVKVACDYPVYHLDKIVSRKFMESGSPAYELVMKFEWSNRDQNTVARYIASDGLSYEQAAKKWVDANREVWEAWLPTAYIED